MNRAVAREVATDDDFEVTVAAPRFFRGDLRDLHIEPEPTDSRIRLTALEAYWTKPIHLFRYDLSALRRLVAQGRFDVVHAWEEPYIYAGYQIARSVSQSPARFCFRTAQSYSKRLPPPFGHFERACLARAQGWIAGGQLVHEAMLSRDYPRHLGRILTLAVDTEAFVPLDSAACQAAHTRLGLTSPVIGFMGRLTPEKGLRLLMKALERLGDQRAWHLMLLGSGPMEGELRRWAARRGWSRRVWIGLARHDEVPAFLGAMDFLVAPSQTTRSWREQFGRMLIEAFACGVPVIASDSGEIPFVVGGAGLVVGERDEMGWTRAIGALLADAPRRAAMARQGLQRSQNYSVATVAASYRQFYQDLAARPPWAGGRSA